MKILVLNAGSSSQKSCLYDLTGDTLPSHAPEPIWEAMIDWTVWEGKGLLTVKANGHWFSLVKSIKPCWVGG